VHTATVLAALTRSLVDCAVELGFARASLLERAGLSAEEFADPDARVPLATHLALWTALAERPCGLELGARLGLRGLGVVGYALERGTTVADALALLNRARDLVARGAVPTSHVVESDRGSELMWRQSLPPPFAALREPAEAQASATLAVMRALAGDDVRPLHVVFPHAAPQDTRRHEARFGCPLRWSGPALELTFDARLLARPLPREEPALFGYLETRVAALAAALPEDASLSARVRDELERTLPRGEPSLSAVARRLGLSTRTLQRRLSEERAPFSTLVDDVRRARALALLRDPALSGSEVGLLLGYAETAAFFRAFRRWTGTTPERFRSSS
jgi:AraC-like DNA-binding protein